MRPEVMKGLLGFAIGAAAGITIAKMAKAGKLDIVINEDLIRSLLPREEKVVNPNGEDLTVKPELELIGLNDINNKEVV